MKGAAAAFLVGLVVGAGFMTLRNPGSGERNARDDSLAWNRAVLDSLIRDTERVVPAAQRSETVAMRTRASFDTLRTRVTVSNDTVSTPNTTVVDFELAELIRTSDRVAVTHEAAVDSAHLALAAMTAERNAWKLRAEMFERQLAAERASRPRFGFKSGVVVGAGVVILLLGALAGVTP